MVQVPNADFFLKTVPLLDGGQDVGMVLSPQASEDCHACWGGMQGQHCCRCQGFVAGDGLPYHAVTGNLAASIIFTLGRCPAIHLQYFYNLNADGDIFNHANVHFWDYTQPGYDALGVISCTGTNFLVRGQAFKQVCACGLLHCGQGSPSSSGPHGSPHAGRLWVALPAMPPTRLQHTLMLCAGWLVPGVDAD